MGRFRPNDRYDRFGNYSFEDTGLIGENKSINHVGLSFHPCPFSTQAIRTPITTIYGTTDPYRHIKILLKDFYTEVVDGTDYILLEGTTLYVPIDLADHTQNGTIYYLREEYKGAWGYECTFPGCPHQAITNRPYFYI